MIRRQSKFARCVCLWVSVCPLAVRSLSVQDLACHESGDIHTHSGEGTSYIQGDMYVQSLSLALHQSLLELLMRLMSISVAAGDTNSVFICGCPRR